MRLDELWGVTHAPESFEGFSCSWGFTWDQIRAGSLPFPFLLSCLLASPGSPSLINHFPRNFWLNVRFWENPNSDALGRLLALQLCVSLAAGHSTSEFAPLQQDRLEAQTVYPPKPLHFHSKPRVLQQLRSSVQNSLKESKFFFLTTVF